MNQIDTLSPWLININGLKPNNPIIVMFAYAGAGASVFYRWAKELDQSSVILVQLPGREQRSGEALPDSLVQCATEIVENLCEHLPQSSRCTFFGHSLGALMAYEVAYQHGQRAFNKSFSIEHIVLSGRGSPSSAPTLSLVHTLPRQEFWQAIVKEGGMVKEIMAIPEMLDLIEPVLRADLKLNCEYVWQPKVKLQIPLTVLGGSEDSHYHIDALHNWQEVTSCSVHVKEYQGDHFFISNHMAPIIELLKDLSKTPQINHVACSNA
ncbi:Thioesterase PikA5 [Pseudoalteromonas holothuriae]|uniref:Thioesterase PikA5 n=1 Tax=Pseudoalteromonas holothuriae TaxID=2963714 RepID=A0A9W4QTD8_9GAMM|nr:MULTISPECIES: thioesterase domain-containing protein [unclassified Pseudoalteromonas]CAH9050329.1 Thioesterase PikA5 [Pseudoalteromonas sp. CIP111951]CAH9052348.1 Thioesterase PikA5 [Pseudoalteromonas sp. CIP111854]